MIHLDLVMTFIWISYDSISISDGCHVHFTRICMGLIMTSQMLVSFRSPIISPGMPGKYWQHPTKTRWTGDLRMTRLLGCGPPNSHDAKTYFSRFPGPPGDVWPSSSAKTPNVQGHWENMNPDTQNNAIQKVYIKKNPFRLHSFVKLMRDIL